MKKVLKRIIIVLIVILICILSMLIYFENYYHADIDSYKYLESSDLVKISKEDKYYFFDGPGENNAIIFYQGAKVETESYARLMYELASNGIDCFLLDIPFRFAFFGINYPNNIINNYSYDNWYLMGHSLGGVAASSYLEKHNNFKGIIFLASYPNNKIDENVKVISIYGIDDQVLNKDRYNKASFPANYKEYVIEGNHSGYADYGMQKGDGVSTVENYIEQDEVLNILIKEILE